MPSLVRAGQPRSAFCVHSAGAVTCPMARKIPLLPERPFRPNVRDRQQGKLGGWLKGGKALPGSQKTMFKTPSPEDPATNEGDSFKMIGFKSTRKTGFPVTPPPSTLSGLLQVGSHRQAAGHRLSVFRYSPPTDPEAESHRFLGIVNIV